MTKRKNEDGTCYSCGGRDGLRKLYKRTNGVWSLICRPCNNAKSKKYYDRKKTEVFSHYGNECRCCGETEINFLSIDHVNNDGHLEIRSSGSRISGVHLYPKLVKAGFPETYQLLCMNCNFGKRMNNGVCPHEMVK